MPRALLLLLACLVLALISAGCGDDEPSKGAGGATAEATPEDTGGEQGSGCKPAQRPKPGRVELDKPRARLRAGTTYVATVVTNCGQFEITLDSERAPRTGGSFKHLADKGFYDGLSFHRISPGFVIQGGDPKGDGTGGPGYSVVEEPPKDVAYTKGVVAMAKTQIEDPGTSGSQFFVVTGEDTGLPSEYALVGKVTKGQDVVDTIGVAPVGADERPKDPIVIQQVKIEER